MLSVALVADIRPGSGESNIRDVANVGGTLYFFAIDGTSGKILWNKRSNVDFPGGGRGPAYGDGRVYGAGRSVIAAFDADMPYEEIRRWLERRLMPDAFVYEEFHALLVRAGYHNCKPTPACATCPATTPRVLR